MVYIYLVEVLVTLILEVYLIYWNNLHWFTYILGLISPWVLQCFKIKILIIRDYEDLFISLHNNFSGCTSTHNTKHFVYNYFTFNIRFWGVILSLWLFTLFRGWLYSFVIGFPWVHLVVLPSLQFCFLKILSSWFLQGHMILPCPLVCSGYLLYYMVILVRLFILGIFFTYSYSTWVLFLFYFSFLGFIYLHTILLHFGSLLLFIFVFS